MKVSGFIWDDCDYKCNYDLLKELGVDVPYVGYDKGMNYTIKGLNRAQSNGMQIIVTAWPFWSYFKRDAQTAASTYSYQISQLLKHEALHSIYIWDEPSMTRLNEVKELVTKTRAWQEKLGTNKKLYINLLPNYANETQLGTTDYHEYVDTFAQLSDVVGGDYYFVREKDGKTIIPTEENWPGTKICPRAFYVFCRELFDASKKYKKPLWLWLASAHHNKFAKLDDIALRLEFNIGYILGAEFMHFWTIRQPREDQITTPYSDCQIEQDYSKGTTFDTVKNYLKNTVPHLNDIFDKCTVIDFGKVDKDTPKINEDVPFDAGTNDIYWNKMEDKDGKKYWTVMNFSVSNTITVKVKSGYTFYNKEFKEETISGTQKEIKLLPGELLVIKYSYVKNESLIKKCQKLLSKLTKKIIYIIKSR